jgi:hypothetical protein
MHTLQIFIWFVRLSLYGTVVLVPLALLAVVAIVILIRSVPIERWKYWLLTPLPLLWIFVGLWGGYFWLHWENTPVVRNPEWVLYPVRYGIWVFCAIAFGLAATLREVRWFVLLFILLNFYFMLAMTMLAGMAVTGDWL